MSVDEITRPLDVTDPLRRLHEIARAQSEMAQPSRWVVTLHDPLGTQVKCGVCILRVVFRMKADEARQRVIEASNRGLSVVFSGTQEVAEARRIRAEGKKNQMEQTCNRSVGSIRFEVSKA